MEYTAIMIIIKPCTGVRILAMTLMAVPMKAAQKMTTNVNSE